MQVFYYVAADVISLNWNSAYTHIPRINFKMLITLLRYIVKKHKTLFWNMYLGIFFKEWGNNVGKTNKH